MSDDKTSAYASAELGTELRGDNSSELIRAYAGLIDDSESLELLNYYDSLLEDEGGIVDDPLGQTIISDKGTETVDGAVRAGNVSQMKAAMGMTNQTEDGEDLYAVAARELSYEGAIGLVLGSPGAGKTATTVDVATEWKVRTGGTVIGNTEWDGFDAHVTSDIEMFEAMANTKGPVLCVLDEIAQELSGFGSGNKTAEAFSNSCLHIRKRVREYGPHPMKGSLLTVAHTRKKTAKSIREIASFAIEKPKRSDPGVARILSSEGGKDKFQEDGDFQGLTDTAFNYDEYDPSDFEILETYDGEDEDDESAAEDAEQIQRDEHIKTAIRACASGMKYADAAELVPWSSDWVGERYREWRDENQHTELVPKDEVSEA